MSIRTICVATPAQRMELEQLVGTLPGVEVVAWVAPTELEQAVKEVLPDLVLAPPNPTRAPHAVHESAPQPYGTGLVALPVAGGIEVRNRLDVVRIQGDAGYARIICDNAASVLLSKSLSQCQAMFRPDHGFVRVHRSAIVNMRYARRIVRRRSLQLVLTNGDAVEVGDRYREQLYAFLGIDGTRGIRFHDAMNTA